MGPVNETTWEGSGNDVSVGVLYRSLYCAILYPRMLRNTSAMKVAPPNMLFCALSI